ncbi:hypothetical protein ABPG74_014335 [Tetrahymena malaccensis]
MFLILKKAGQGLWIGFLLWSVGQVTWVTMSQCYLYTTGHRNHYRITVPRWNITDGNEPGTTMLVIAQPEQSLQNIYKSISDKSINQKNLYFMGLSIIYNNLPFQDCWGLQIKNQINQIYSIKIISIQDKKIKIIVQYQKNSWIQVIDNAQYISDIQA